MSDYVIKTFFCFFMKKIFMKIKKKHLLFRKMAVICCLFSGLLHHKNNVRRYLTYNPVLLRACQKTNKLNNDYSRVIKVTKDYYIVNIKAYFPSRPHLKIVSKRTLKEVYRFMYYIDPPPLFFLIKAYDF